MKYLLFFTALIATATAAELICECATPMPGIACTEGKTTCTIPDGVGQCYSTLRQISTEKDKSASVTSKGCQPNADPNVCKDKGTVFISTDDAFYLLDIIQCCNANSCNKDVVSDVPTLNKTVVSKNLVCPSCFALGKKTCDDKQMYCKENQNKCFNISGTITKGTTVPQDFIAKGCAPPNTLLKNDTTLTFGDTAYKLEKAELVDAKSGVSQISSCLSFAILLPSILWFLLDSSLY